MDSPYQTHKRKRTYDFHALPPAKRQKKRHNPITNEPHPPTTMTHGALVAWAELETETYLQDEIDQAKLQDEETRRLKKTPFDCLHDKQAIFTDVVPRSSMPPEFRNQRILNQTKPNEDDALVELMESSNPLFVIATKHMKHAPGK